MHSFFVLLKRVVDFYVTVILWVYFTMGFVFLFIPVLIALYPFFKNKKTLFQLLDHFFCLGFIFLLNILNPGMSLYINHSVKKIRSSIIISNHISYFDPILFVSIYKKQKTIVKGIFFKLPFMGWLLRSSGYIPFMPDGTYNGIIMDHIKDINSFIADGGNLFIFPEGRRSRNGKIGKLQKGAFSIAVKYQIPVEVLYISNTNRVFSPGKFFVNTCTNNNISIERLGTIKPDKTVNEMREKAIELYNKRI